MLIKILTCYKTTAGNLDCTDSTRMIFFNILELHFKMQYAVKGHSKTFQRYSSYSL